jgi:hypothetical protein
LSIQACLNRVPLSFEHCLKEIADFCFVVNDNNMSHKFSFCMTGWAPGKFGSDRLHLLFFEQIGMWQWRVSAVLLYYKHQG